MTIISVDRMWSRHDATLQDDAFTVIENFQVVHSVDDNWATINNGVDPTTGLRVPNIGDSYNRNGLVLANVTVTDLKFTQASPIMSIVTATFEGIGSDTLATGAPKISWTDSESDEAIDQDFNGKPIVTANNEPLEGLTMKVADQVVTIERKFLSFNPYVVNAYRHSTNSDIFLDYLPGMARLVRYAATLSGGLWEVSASIQFRYPYRCTPDQAWYARVRHEGYYIRDVADGAIRRALDTDVAPGQTPPAPGEPVIKPVLLDSDGLIVTDQNNAEWLYFQRYGSLPYNALGLL